MPKIVLSMSVAGLQKECQTELDDQKFLQKYGLGKGFSGIGKKSAEVPALSDLDSLRHANKRLRKSFEKIAA